MKVSQPVLILTGQIIQPGVDMVCEADLKTGRLQDFDAGLKIGFIKRARRRDDADSVPRPQPGWLYDSCVFDKVYPFVKELNSVHPETTNFWMELSAVSDQQSANTLFLMAFAESRKLMADSANPKTLISG